MKKLFFGVYMRSLTTSRVDDYFFHPLNETVWGLELKSASDQKNQERGKRSGATHRHLKIEGMSHGSHSCAMSV